MNNQKDLIYTQLDGQSDFTFNSQVAEVFDDMALRSIPNYQNLLHGISLLAQSYAQPSSKIYDLGCSLGSITSLMRQRLETLSPIAGLEFVAVDASPAMIERAKLRLASYKSSYPLEVIEQDITTLDLQPASMVILNFVLQFLKPQQRLAMLDKIYHALLPGGLLVLSEKIEADPILSELHLGFKASQGYSQLEIERKRQALENVMRLESLEQHLQRLQDLGFSKVLTWQQSYNFISILAVK